MSLENIEIRPVSPDDACEILEIYRPYVENTAITFECRVPDVTEFRHRIESTLEKYPYIVAVRSGEIVGYAYAGPFKPRAAYDWSVETSVYVKMEEKGKGIGGLLYKELEERLRNMGIRNVCACIAFASVEDEHLDNNSLFFHEHIGYSLCAHFHKCANKFGKWYDMVWVEKAINEHSEKPKAPLFGKYI